MSLCLRHKIYDEHPLIPDDLIFGTSFHLRLHDTLHTVLRIVLVASTDSLLSVSRFRFVRAISLSSPAIIFSKVFPFRQLTSLCVLIVIVRHIHFIWFAPAYVLELCKLSSLTMLCHGGHKPLFWTDSDSNLTATWTLASGRGSERVYPTNPECLGCITARNVSTFLFVPLLVLWTDKPS
jgi:hypothetical protein